MPDGFELGDTVQLKSGGPLMTIESFGVQRQGSETQGAHCVWFEKNRGKQERKMNWFALHSIKKVNPDAESSFYPGNPIMG